MYERTEAMEQIDNCRELHCCNSEICEHYAKCNAEYAIHESFLTMSDRYE